MKNQDTKKLRKPILILTEPKTYWGKLTCEFCNKRIFSYNHDRHVNSKKHLEILLKNNSIQVTNDLTVRFTGKIDHDFINELRSKIGN